MSDTFNTYLDDAFVTFDSKCTKDDTRSILEKQDFTNKKVLDVGGGYGSYLKSMKPTWAQFTLLDKSPVLLKEAERRAKELNFTNIDFVEHTAEQLPFEDNSFDVVMCTFALCEIPDWKKAFHEMTRVLKPDGELLLVDSIGGNNDFFYDLLHIADVYCKEPFNRESPEIWAYLTTYIPEHAAIVETQAYTTEYEFDSVDDALTILQGLEPRMKTNDALNEHIRHYLKQHEQNGIVFLEMDAVYLKLKIKK